MRDSREFASLPLEAAAEEWSWALRVPGVRRIELGRGAVAQRERDSLERFHLVRRGAIACLTTAGSGRRAIYDIVGPGDLCGWPAGGTAPELRALSEASVLFGASQALTRAVEEDVAVSASVASALGRRADRLAGRLATTLTDGVAERVLNLLWELSLRFGCGVGGARRLPFDLTQDSIAAMAGASRESVNRALRDLRAAGRVRRHRRRYEAV